MESLTVFSTGKTGIYWQHISPDEAIIKAKTAHKHILVYFTAKWCGPCRAMEQKVFPHHAVAEMVNNHYIAVKVDIDAWAAKRWMNDFAVKGVPDFFILDTAKQRLRHLIGYTDREKFLSFLRLDQTPVDLKILNIPSVENQPERWQLKPLAGVEAGYSHVTGYRAANAFAFSFKTGLRIEKKRLFFVPQLHYIRAGMKGQHLHYVRLPVDIGINFYRGELLGLPGGYRVLAGPYYGRFLSGTNSTIHKNDIGIQYGVAAYIGDVGQSSIELSLRSSAGFNDLFPALSGKQKNRILSLSVALAFGR